MISLTEARQWHAQRQRRPAATDRRRYAQHQQLVIDLHFGPDRWTASDIARLVKEKDKDLKHHKLNTLTAAFCRIIRRAEAVKQAASLSK